MGHLFIHFRESIVKLFVCIILCFTFLSCFSQQIIYPSGGNPDVGVSGRYQKVNGDEILLFNSDGAFICLRNHIQKSDVVIPLCDTLSKGFWSLKDGFILLKNRNGFNDVKYSIIESTMGSQDSVYFKIILPEEDAFSYNNFKFSIVTSPIYRQFVKSGKSELAISKKQWGNMAFGLVIQNISPNVYYGMKSYQRVYFKIFESYKAIDGSKNCFTILVSGFNQCFYESMDIDNEVIGIDNNTLIWRGNIYKKSK
ncbi:hypothetical protein CLV59_103419 [Chitinophaga dinghuensis]|uniref:Uncharacterized protein n=1 Tax=Chitinophaga dinghuensis TaxID=1539050 RepID=A0A327W2E9_9BACT|nr:hypothetical protein [Chitinophaga dinghuensis]RAJ83451.1 hypothetical protein CLV59_103419 [Chitinophaga dinghuensis]